MDSNESLEIISVNETPVRTSKNYNINNVCVDEKEIVSQTGNFENIDIIRNSDKIFIDDNTSEFDLKFGISEFLNKQISENSNVNKKIVVSSKTNQELQLHFNIDEDNLNLVDNLEIIVDENCKATIIIKYVCNENTCSSKECKKVEVNGNKNIQGYHNGLIRINAKEGANVNVTVINFVNNYTNNFVSLQNEIEKNASIKYNIIDFGGSKSITNYYSNIKGENASNNLNCIYLGNKKQKFDLNYIAELRGEKSSVNIEVQGALKDNAKKHFKGTIDFKKGCKKAKGNENENCVLLSDKAKSIALPMLLCTEEDVEGNHSTSAGKIEEKELFYIMSRGIDKNEAMKLRVKANFNNILKNIKNEDIKNEILREINCKMDI